MRIRTVLFLCIILLLTFQAQSAETPLAIVKNSIGEMLDILASEEYRNEENRQPLREKIFSIANDRFFWEEIAKRSLGRKWKDQTREDQERFVSLFTRLLKDNYIGKLESYSQQQVIYEEEIFKGQYAEVRTKIVQEKGEDIPVYYRMINEGGTWLVYDVVIEGISLVKNYRSQFEDMLSKSSFKEFLDKIENKLKEEKK
ncbi:MAG: ABC transporter substrate-binding protein [Candidatus Aureabacteria bacterium]|nr:ABC transporter substrate-binding protein [Candidatus Auribacterota bacterium]